VDNGSTDGTARVTASLGAAVRWEPKKGYGAACLAGMEALGPDIEIVVFLDGDYSDYPEELETLVRLIEENLADFVIGSRMLRKEARGGAQLATALGQSLGYADGGLAVRVSVHRPGAFPGDPPRRARFAAHAGPRIWMDRGNAGESGVRGLARAGGSGALPVANRALQDQRHRLGRTAREQKILYTIAKYALH